MRSRLRFPLVLVCVLLAPAFSRAETKLVPATVAKLDRAVTEQMAKQDLVGLAVGVIRDGQVVYTQGYGLANREEKLPVTAETVFNWASNSKPVAGVLAVQLAAQGRLDLDADIRRYLPEFPEKSGVITTRHLLCHQSGIPHYGNGKVLPSPIPANAPDLNHDPVTALHKFDQSPLIFAPGEKVAYSSYAYVLLCAVIQRAGEKPFEEQVRELLQPLEMKSFQWDEPTSAQPHWTVGYTRSKNGKVTVVGEESHGWKQGAGGFKSNINDFARWGAALTGDELLKDPERKIGWVRQRTNNGQETSWGLGVTLGTHGPGSVSHNGQQSETATTMVLFPMRKSGVVILCNSSYAKIDEISAAIRNVLRDE